MSEGELQKAKIAFLDRRVDDLACMEPCARLDSGACLDAMSQNSSFSERGSFCTTSAGYMCGSMRTFKYGECTLIAVLHVEILAADCLRVVHNSLY